MGGMKMCEPRWREMGLLWGSGERRRSLGQRAVGSGKPSLGAHGGSRTTLLRCGGPLPDYREGRPPTAPSCSDCL